MTLTSAIGLGIWLTATGLTLFGTYLTWKHFGQTVDRLDSPFALIPVSILKPLKGIDPNLESNLHSFFLLDYPLYELIFSVADEADPALDLVKKVMLEYPSVHARISVGETPLGANPKVNNLVKSYESAAYDWILISDSNVRIKPDSLKRQVAQINPGVGIITSVVLGTEGTGLGGKLEAMFLNTFYARGMVLAQELGKPCVMGKSMLFQRSTANRFGGIRVLARYLAEDFMAGEAMRKLGLKIHISIDPVVQIIGGHSMEAFWSRHLRWGRIRKVQAPLAFAIEPLLGSAVSGVIGSLAVAHGFFWISLFLGAHLLLWRTCDWITARKLGATDRQSVFLWAFREFSALPLWLHISMGRSVQWRGQKLVLETGGILSSSVSTERAPA